MSDFPIYRTGHNACYFARSALSCYKDPVDAQQASQVPTWFALVLAVGSALVTGIVSVVLAWMQLSSKRLELRWQSELKAAELRSQVELKPCEVLFGFYQDRTKEFAKDADRLSELLRSLTDAKGSPPSNEEFQFAMLVMVQQVASSLRWTLLELEKEAGGDKKFADLLDDVQRAKEFLSKDLRVDTPDQAADVYLNFVKAGAVLHVLRDRLLVRKCELLFSPWANAGIRTN